MIILPAVVLHDGKCVRLFQGDSSTAEVVADDPVEAAVLFREQGADWVHIVDLDGVKAGRPVNEELIFRMLEASGAYIQAGGGIRDMETVDRYISRGVKRVVLGSAAVNDPMLLGDAIRKYDDKIAVAVDSLDGMAAMSGWKETCGMTYLELARRVDAMGARYIVFTDITDAGAMGGPNLSRLDRLNRAVSCRIIASGGVSSLLDLLALHDLGLYGAVASKAIYSRTLDLKTAIMACRRISEADEKR